MARVDLFIFFDFDSSVFISSFELFFLINLVGYRSFELLSIDELLDYQADV